MVTLRFLSWETREIVDIWVEKILGSVLCMVGESIAGMGAREEWQEEGEMLI